MNRPSYSCFALALVAVTTPVACVHRAPASNPFIHGRPSDVGLPATANHDSPSQVAARARHLRAEAATRVRPFVRTMETADPALSRALREVGVAPAPATHRRVAIEYLRLEISDRAGDHLSAAIALDPRDAASYDLRARLWRDWGLPGEGLGDAYRAAYYAPGSAASQNTLGTMLHRLGHYAGARARYGRALALDPTAAFALNNLCAVALDEGDAGRGLAACREALSLEPGLEAAIRNLQAAVDLAARQGPNHERN